jgi:hypothetical protein
MAADPLPSARSMEYLTQQKLPAHLNPLQTRTMRRSHNQPSERQNSLPSLAPVRSSISSHLSILPPLSAIPRRPPPSVSSVLQIYHDIPSIGSVDDPLVHVSPSRSVIRRFSRPLGGPSQDPRLPSQARNEPTQHLEHRPTTTAENAASNTSPQGRILRDSPPLQPGEQPPNECRLPSFNEVCLLDATCNSKPNHED